MKPSILLQDVWVKYDHQSVLEEITLAIYPREIVSIVGPNGSGKTTLLNTILGFIEPYRGSVRVFELSPRKMKQNGLIGYLPQNIEVDPKFPINVFDVVSMTRYARKPFYARLTGKDREIIMQCLEKVEMEKLIHHHFGTLSGGQKQRVLIARALALQPKILILDEPSTGLDAVAQDRFYHLLQTLRDQEELTILMVSHDIGAVSGIVDQIACLNRRIHFHGKPEDCIPSEALERVFGKNVHFVLHDKNCEMCEKRKC